MHYIIVNSVVSYNSAVVIKPGYHLTDSEYQNLIPESKKC